VTFNAVPRRGPEELSSIPVMLGVYLRVVCGFRFAHRKRRLDNLSVPQTFASWTICETILSVADPVFVRCIAVFYTLHRGFLIAAF
jgi:hypothetical protein